jgi:hypothetical protein
MIILNFCVACGDSNPEHLQQHHLVPRSCGGSDDNTNKITLCCICHGKWHGIERDNSHKALIFAGMNRAKAKGTKSGKPIGRPALVPQTRTAIRHAYNAGGASMRSIAKRFNVSVETVRRSLA